MIGRAATALLLLAGASACSEQKIAAAVPGVLNATGNRTLRRELLGFGAQTLCAEVLKRSVPLRLNTDDPSLGRFFARQCATRATNGGNLVIRFSGIGYAWSNLTHKVGFEADATIDYDPDFRVSGSAMYVYFRAANVTEQRFGLKMVEQVNAGPLSYIMPSNPQDFTSVLGRAVLGNELLRGFTVIRDGDGGVTLSLGTLPPGDRPAAPFFRAESERALIANERIDLHQNTRDFAGPFEVEKNGQTLNISMVVEGAPAVDVLAYPVQVAEPWLQTYVQSSEPTPPNAAPVFQDQVLAGAVYRKSVRLPRGSYYLVLDNTGTAGVTPPAGSARDDRTATVGLGVELSDGP